MVSPAAATLGETFSIAVAGTAVVTSAPDQEVSDFDTVRVTFNLNDGDAISFTIPDDSPAAPYLDGLASDVFLFNKLDNTRSDHLWQRYRVLPLRQAWSADGGSAVTVDAVCYKHLMKARRLHPDANGLAPTFTNYEQAFIIRDLIAHTQGLTGRNLGITTSTAVTTGQARDRTEYKVGDVIYDLIDNLTKVINGPTWRVYPGTTSTVQLQTQMLSAFPVWTDPIVYGDNAVSLDRDPGDFANSVFVPGTQETTYSWYDMASAATDPRGVWEASVSPSSSVVRQSEIDQLAQGTATEMSKPPATWQIEMDVARWLSDSRYMPGALVPLKVPIATIDPLAAEAADVVNVRVVDVQLDVDKTGGLSVKLAAVEDT